MASTALLCFGSNLGAEADEKIDQALAALMQPGCAMYASSGKYQTPCYSQGRVVDGASYLNEVVIIQTDLDAPALEALAKATEIALGRTAEARALRQVPIDIDIVAFDGKILRINDFNSPYFIKGYKKIMENKLAKLWEPWSVAPDPSIDMAQWQVQYQKNPELWDKLFDFLAHTDLSSLQPGKVVLVPGRLWINVLEYTPKDAENTAAEAHKRYIDLQYTRRGNELMGLVKGSVEVTIPYNEVKDVEKYRPTGEVDYSEATPDKFYIYFPSDIHQPSVASCADPGLSHKLVGKIEYAE